MDLDPDSQPVTSPYERYTHTLMSRRRRKTSKDEFDQVYRKCHYCKAHRDTWLFDRHVIACKTRWQSENQRLLSHITTTVETRTIQPQAQLPEDFVEGSNGVQLAEELDTFLTSSAPVESNPNPGE